MPASCSSGGSPSCCWRGKCCASPFQQVGVGPSPLSKACSVAVLASPFQQESLSKKHFCSSNLRSFPSASWSCSGGCLHLTSSLNPCLCVWFWSGMGENLPERSCLVPTLAFALLYLGWRGMQSSTGHQNDTCPSGCSGQGMNRLSLYGKLRWVYPKGLDSDFFA